MRIKPEWRLLLTLGDEGAKLVYLPKSSSFPIPYSPFPTPYRG